jgi:hypothetical protein
MRYQCMIFTDSANRVVLSEQLTGFYLIETKDLNEAIRVASGIPSARYGAVEIRPIRVVED